MSDAPLVLCADDDGDILALVALRLERAGYEVVTAGDGDAALALARARVPSVAVLDVMMPRRTGLEVLAELRTDPVFVSLKVILLSARVQEADMERGIDAGADAYFPKPFKASELVDAVQALLNP
ncbi:MAG: response regulator [Actinobacteria bacterium]|nr:response regulator [Actinomycetota bacterium]